MGTSAPPSSGLELALLGLLRARPHHAYELHQELQRNAALGFVWRLKQGHLYALLAKLEEAGYVASSVELRGTRPPRKMLRLTARGHEAFSRWLEQPVEHGRDFRLAFLAKLYFATQEGGMAVGTLLARQRAACHTWAADLARQVQAVSLAPPFQRLVLQFRSSQLEAILSWLDTCESTLAPRVAP